MASIVKRLSATVRAWTQLPAYFERMERRSFLALAGLSATHALWGCHDEESPESLFLGGFLTSLTVERDYQPSVSGRLPADLTGTLYRNGPGLFERGGVRKNTLVDGDGMVNAYFFDGDGGVRFKNRFTRTEKFLEEEQAQRYLYDTWTTKAPDGEALPKFGNQAGVSVWKVAGRLFAFDESDFPYELDPDTLETIGIDGLGFEEGENLFAAHPKLLAETKEFATFGVDYATGTVHLTVLAADGSVAEHRTHVIDPITYVHDFFATASHFVLALQPVELAFEELLTGKSVWESLSWRPELGMRWLVFERGSDAPPTEIVEPAHWMWHGGNMFALGDDLVCDWVAYEDPFHFLGRDAEFAQLMDGRRVATGARSHLRRTVLSPASKTLTSEIASDAGHFEFPGIDRRRWGLPHRHVYAAFNPRRDALWTGLIDVDTDTGQERVFDFGEDHVCGEPIFAPGEDDAGWLLAEVSDATQSRAFLAIFDAADISDGPIARVELDHHLPIRFHGHWVPSGG